MSSQTGSPIASLFTQLGESKLRFSITNSGEKYTIAFDNVIYTRIWMHFTVVLSQTSIDFYLNGVNIKDMN